MAMEFTDKNFAEEAGSGIVLVDFWAPWCGPCRMVGPIIEEIAAEYTGRVKVGKVNVDDNSEVASKYGIMSIPTLMFMKDGEVIDQLVGAVPKATISSKLEEILVL